MENFNGEFNTDTSAFENEALNGVEFLEYEDEDDDVEMSAEYEDEDDDEAELSELDYDDEEESYSEFEDGDDDDEADPEFLGALAGLAAPLLSKGISGAVRGVSRLLRRKPSRRVRSYGRGRKPSIYRGRVARIARSSKLRGMLRTPRGRRMPIRLPKNIATKRDVLALRKSVTANRRIANANTKRVGRVVLDLKKARAHVNSVDKKHTKASTAQNRVIGGMNKKLIKVNKDVDKTKGQLQMNQMMSMLMAPELETFTIEKVGDGTGTAATELAGSKVTLTSSTNKENNLGMMMAMSGGFGGDSGMNPMMMYLMMDK